MTVRTKMMVSLTPDHHLAFYHNYLQQSDLGNRSDQDDGLARK
jgi:hypothetical protein